MFRTHLFDGAGIFIRHRESMANASIIASRAGEEWKVSGTGKTLLQYGAWLTFQFEGVALKVSFRQKRFMKREALEVRVDAPKIIEISPLCRPFKKGA